MPRENAIIRMRARSDWQQLLQGDLSRHALMSFHARYKYQLMANNPSQYRVLGKLLGSMGRSDATELGPRYFSLLMNALNRCATRGNHANVLLHLSGYLRHSINAQDKQEIRQLIEAYRQGAIPLAAPIDLLKHHFEQHPDPYVLQQVYLQPHPEAPGPRNAL
ncbi:DUF1722 domain-containing protein [Pseudomonas akapageensis]|uniref:DUF1722 domain-containing protein n=1 Tax=Pseudomonas akapageensis TaxID=2609961 RepID=UPI001409F934